MERTMASGAVFLLVHPSIYPPQWNALMDPKDSAGRAERNSAECKYCGRSQNKSGGTNGTTTRCAKK